MEIAISGLGFVGSEVYKMFPEASVIDPKYKNRAMIANRPRFYESPPDQFFDVCFVCVPTPMKESGECDTSFVESAIRNTKAHLFIIRSTIPPGTTEELEDKLGKNLVFQPEYVASSSPYPAPLADMGNRSFIILGGRKANTKRARRLYEAKYPPTTRFLEVSSRTAEIIKSAENSFIGLYVSFCSEFAQIAKTYNVDWDEVREGFLLDPRMTPWWTYVKSGFGSSHCITKDMNSIIKATEKKGYEPKLLKEALDTNRRIYEN